MSTKKHFHMIQVSSIITPTMGDSNGGVNIETQEILASLKPDELSGLYINKNII